jgi:hypothetical protein
MNRLAALTWLLALLAGGGATRPGLLAGEPTATNPPPASPPPPETGVATLFLEAKEAIASDRRVPGTVRVVPSPGAPAGSNGTVRGEVRIHGATSQGYPKKSYALTLESPAPLLGMSSGRHWVLNASYIDRSLMRHKLGYDLFRSLSAPGAKRFAAASRFVELHLNGHYNGVYLLIERVDRQLLQFGPYRSNDLEHACLYKAVDHAANFGQGGHDGYEQREPDPTLLPYWLPLDGFNRFVSAVPAAEFFQPTTGIASRLDLDNAIDFQLLVLVTSNADGITKNFFLARAGPSPGAMAPRFFFAPWDYDGTFGRNWDASPFPHDAWLSNHLFDRLREDQAYRERFKARWKQLRQRQLTVENIRAMIDANVRALGEAPRRNAKQWPTTDGPYPDRISFEQDIAQMKSWIGVRLEWLDQEINR